ncbi:MAG: hypothetical protein LBH07_05940 [Treponema sp.]|jgi:hypothetical protein|nr:hypothetical protein [Treponema sp.]
MAAHFFCDNCGEEVKRNSNRCPQCGRFFAFVRCPQCGYTGEEGRFLKGCPVCGYCDSGQKKEVPNDFSGRLPLASAGKLPLWVYFVTILGLITVALVLYLII